MKLNIMFAFKMLIFLNPVDIVNFILFCVFVGRTRNEPHSHQTKV